ncbi:thioredoxin family protein [Methanobrevibacter sp.]
MRKITYLALAIILTLTLTMAVSAVGQENQTVQGLNATRDIGLAFNESQSQNKTLLIIFDQESCVYCDMLEENTLSDVNVQKELNENYVVLFVDINKDYDVAEKYQVFGTPIVHVVSPEGKDLGKIEGYVESDEFLSELKGI